MELGRLLGKSGSSGSSTWGSSAVAANEVNGKSTSSSSSVGKSQTPFIDATVEFLKEFIVVEENEKGRKKGNGNNGFGKGGKGKEKEVVRDEDGVAARGEGDDEEEDEWPQSFLPTYVYEAMKEKKRFESMRVSCPHLLCPGVLIDAYTVLSFFLVRAVNKKTRKSF